LLANYTVSAAYPVSAASRAVGYPGRRGLTH
jgi:hypothetical protein